MRREHDYYPTSHAGATEGLLALAPFAITGTVLECCSGQHHMTNVLRASVLDNPSLFAPARPRFSRVYTNDLVPSLEADFHEDARDERVWREVFPEVDWVITNPTFVGALPIVKHARQHARIGIAFYLRITFWEPTIKGHDPSRHRGPFLRDFPPNGFLPMSRISHTEDGSTDSATCAWFVWHRPMPGVPEQWHRVLILEDPSEDPLEQRNLFAQDPSN